MKTLLVSTQVLSKSEKNVAEGTSYRFDAIDPSVLPHKFYYSSSYQGNITIYLPITCNQHVTTLTIDLLSNS